MSSRRGRAYRRKHLAKERRRASHSPRKLRDDALLKAYYALIKARDYCDECGYGKGDSDLYTVYAPYLYIGGQVDSVHKLYTGASSIRVDKLLLKLSRAAPGQADAAVAYVRDAFATPHHYDYRHCSRCWERYGADLDRWIDPDVLF